MKIILLLLLPLTIFSQQTISNFLLKDSYEFYSIDFFNIEEEKSNYVLAFSNDKKSKFSKHKERTLKLLKFDVNNQFINIDPLKIDDKRINECIVYHEKIDENIKLHFIHQKTKNSYEYSTGIIDFDHYSLKNFTIHYTVNNLSKYHRIMKLGKKLTLIHINQQEEELSLINFTEKKASKIDYKLDKKQLNIIRKNLDYYTFFEEKSKSLIDYRNHYIKLSDDSKTLYFINTDSNSLINTFPLHIIKLDLVNQKTDYTKIEKKYRSNITAMDILDDHLFFIEKNIVDENNDFTTPSKSLEIRKLDLNNFSIDNIINLNEKKIKDHNLDISYHKFKMNSEKNIKESTDYSNLFRSNSYSLKINKIDSLNSQISIAAINWPNPNASYDAVIMPVAYQYGAIGGLIGGLATSLAYKNISVDNTMPYSKGSLYPNNYARINFQLNNKTKRIKKNIHEPNENIYTKVTLENIKLFLKELEYRGVYKNKAFIYLNKSSNAFNIIDFNEKLN